MDTEGAAGHGKTEHRRAVMHLRVKNQLIELLEEEPQSETGHGFMIAFAILLLTFGVTAAILATII